MNLREMRSEFPTLKQGIHDMCNFVNSQITVNKGCEIGSYLGESTVIFAEHFNKCNEFIAVDPYSLQYNTDNLFDEKTVVQVYNKFLENIQPYPCVKHLRKNSNEAAVLFPDFYFDFCYIDGCHQYDSVINDIKMWKKKIKIGGFIGMHDFDNFYVKNAIEQFFDIKQGYYTVDNSVVFKIQ